MDFKIKEYRKEMKMTQTELAEKANVSRATIAGLESGTAKVANTNTLRKIARALNKRVGDIFMD